MSLDNEKNIKFSRGAKPGRRGSGFLKILGTILLIFVTTGLIFTCIFAIYVKTNLSKDFGISMKDFTLNLSSKIFYKDRESGEYKELSSLYSGENRVWVDYKDMPIYLEKAAVSIEDKRFYKHHGVDWYRTGGAVINMFFNMKDTFGGSTLTQQLIKNITKEDQVTVKRKLLEIFRALEFEKNYSKEEIAEMYLNTVFLGESCYGVGSAAQVYFGKNVNELTIAECACLIGITNNPSAYDPYISDKNIERNKTRQELILKEMHGQGYITKQQYDEAVAQKLEFRKGETGGATEAGVNSWYVDAVIEEVIKDLQKQKGLSYGSAETLIFSGGYNIYCTIDPTVQAAVDEVFGDRANMPSGYSKSKTQELQSSMVIIEPNSGDIVGLAGGMGQKTASRIYNRAYDMKRPPGSTIKPLSVYSAAIELGYVMPYTAFNDGANEKLSGSPNWYPNNDDYENRGIVTVRQAITKSINTVAAQIIDMIGASTAYNFLQDRYGFTSLVEGSDASYAPMALGQLTNGATVIEMASAYTAFVNEGVYTRGRLYTKVTDSNNNTVLEKELDRRVAISKLTAYYMTDMMVNVVNSGTGIVAKLSNMPTAGKTGAAGNWLDRWFLGFTPYYVGAVWSGYDNPEYMGSSNPSSALWKAVMSKVHSDLPSKSFSMPDGLTARTVCIDTGLLATEACVNDIRGGHTLTVYMPPEKTPTAYCTVHTMVNVCSESYGLLTSSCPAKDALRVGVLDLSKVPQGMRIKTPDYYSDGVKVQYILQNMFNCTVHTNVIDPKTGWKLDGKTGYFIIPGSGFLYDAKTGKVYDPISKWEIDKETGALIDPRTGKLIDPYTGNEYDGTKKNPVSMPITTPNPTTTPTTKPTTSPTSSPTNTHTPTPTRNP